MLPFYRPEGSIDPLLLSKQSYYHKHRQLVLMSKLRSIQLFSRAKLDNEVKTSYVYIIVLWDNID